MKNGLLKAVFFALLVFPLSAKSTNYYATAGGNDSNAGTFLSASLASGAKAISKILAGDT